MPKMRKILLVEPDYNNKYPPLGLMKLSTYHKLLNDEVHFVKGNYAYYKKQKWDRIYVSTLFTFYWKKTIDCIEYYKNSVKEPEKNMIIGGVLASVIPEKLEKAVGIKPYEGLLDTAGILDKDNDLIVDNMAPDYDILDTIEYQYPTSDSYFGYMTRGCVRQCSFCSVPKIEPKYKSFITLKEQIQFIKETYGEKRHLLLLDNNVLGSKNFDDIIDEIIEMGYGKGAKYQETNLYEFYIYKLQENKNNILYLYKLEKLLNEFYEKLHTKKQLLNRENIYKIFDDNQVIKEVSTYLKYIQQDQEYLYYRYETLLNTHHLISPIYEKYRNKSFKQKYVDFNQGIDARLLSEKKMAKLAQINIKPLRVAFDDLEIKDIYQEKLKLAAKYGIKNSSNYVLYNYYDTPEDLYERLKINIDLNKVYGLNIYSFPMKYMPIEDVDRKHVGVHWNKKYLRNMQILLNTVHGAVMPGESFFNVAFGENVEEFKKILMLPEKYAFYRKINKVASKQLFDDLELLKETSLSRYDDIVNLIKENGFKKLSLNDLPKLEQNILAHYIIDNNKTL